MRPEKQLLVDEVSQHLGKSDYVFLANYERIKVSDVAELRNRLEQEQAEFHVVKNNILKVATRALEYPELDTWLSGPTAIVVGGKNPSGVAKIIKKFFDETSMVKVKVGVLDKRTLSSEDVSRLADLPSLDVLRAQFIGLLATPLRQLLYVLNAVPQGLLTVLQAKADLESKE